MRLTQGKFLNPGRSLTISTVKSRKKGKLRRKLSLALTEFSSNVNNLEDLLYVSDNPSMCIQIIAKPKCRVVLSSQSDDELSSDDLRPEDMLSNHAELCSDELKPEDTMPQTNGYNLLHILASPTSKSQDIYEPLQIDRMYKSITNIAVQNSLDISEIASTSHVYDTSIMQNESCMPESSFFTGIETNLSSAFVPKVLSQNSESTSFDLSISPPILPHADMNSAYGGAVESSKPLENHVGAVDVRIQLLHGNQDVLCFQNEAEVYISSQFQLVDEFSQADFNAQSVHRDTRLQCTVSATRMFYDELAEMGSTFAQHGLCFYTTKCAAAGSCLGLKITSDLAQEMMASSTNSTTIGKLLAKVQASIIHTPRHRNPSQKKVMEINHDTPIKAAIQQLIQ